MGIFSLECKSSGLAPVKQGKTAVSAWKVLKEAVSWLGTSFTPPIIWSFQVSGSSLALSPFSHRRDLGMNMQQSCAYKMCTVAFTQQWTIETFIAISWHCQETLEKFSLRKSVISCLFHVFSLISLCLFSHYSQLLAPPERRIHLGFPWPRLCHYLREYVAPGVLTEEAPEVLGARQYTGHVFSLLYGFTFPPATNSDLCARRVGVCAIC